MKNILTINIFLYIFVANPAWSNVSTRFKNELSCNSFSSKIFSEVIRNSEKVRCEEIYSLDAKLSKRLSWLDFKTQAALNVAFESRNARYTDGILNISFPWVFQSKKLLPDEAFPVFVHEFGHHIFNERVLSVLFPKLSQGIDSRALEMFSLDAQQEWLNDYRRKLTKKEVVKWEKEIQQDQLNISATTNDRVHLPLEIDEVITPYSEVYADLIANLAIGRMDAVSKVFSSPKGELRNFNCSFSSLEWLSTDAHTRLTPVRCWIGKVCASFLDCKDKDRSNLVSALEKTIIELNFTNLNKLTVSNENSAFIKNLALNISKATGINIPELVTKGQGATND
jgi:hypothetical protein